MPCSATNLTTKTTKEGDYYRINGQKVRISHVQYSDLIIVLARTTPKAQCQRNSSGMSAFIVNLHEAVSNRLTVRPIETMINHHSCKLFFDNLKVPAANLLGEEGKGFSCHFR